MLLKDKWVHVKLTDEERTAWKNQADDAGLTVADYIRKSVGRAQMVGREPRKRRLGRKADPLLLANIGRIGSNLNQIARWANSYKSAAEAAEIMLALVAIEQFLQSRVPHKTRKAEPENA